MRVIRVQDSVHGMMEFTGSDALVVGLLDAPEVSRLRGIKQTGLAHYLYPSAEHSRLAHSLGVAYLALRFGFAVARRMDGVAAPSLSPRRENLTDIAIAGLCHDLGHGPFSHFWENEVIGLNYDHRAWASALGMPAPINRPKWHELVTQAMIRSPQSSLHKRLRSIDQDLPARVSSLLEGTYYLSYLCPLLNSDADVDRFDFMLRDAQQCGLRQGQFDLDRLISTIGVGVEDGQLVLGFDRFKAKSALEQFLIARSALYEVVYYHRTVRSAEALMGKFLRRLKAVAGDLRGLRGLSAQTKVLLKVASGETADLGDLSALDDSAVLGAVRLAGTMSKGDPTLVDLARRLQRRELLKDCRVPEGAMDGYIGAGTPKRNEVDAQIRQVVAKSLPLGLDPDSYWLIDERPSKKIFGPEEAKAGESGAPEDLYLLDRGIPILARTTDFKDYARKFPIAHRCFVVRDARTEVHDIFTRHFGKA